ncbi:MAG TPA: hypothetical protein VFB14_27405 [Bryobacteraceae bacterium]|jgi:hypothetical protein|nr:hypothetical protein [Bryobacteraceae bacterium]
MRHSRSWVKANLPVLFWIALMALVFAETVALRHLSAAKHVLR